MIETSSGLPQKSFEKSSEIFGKWQEIFRKLSKILSSVCLYNKKNNFMLAQRCKVYVLVGKTQSNGSALLTCKRRAFS